ncbi:MAG: hypothetical protein QME76_12495 [Bacillota bacterium]|nr:hypothetical protein [Bacillota bacterium]
MLCVAEIVAYKQPAVLLALGWTVMAGRPQPARVCRSGQPVVGVEGLMAHRSYERVRGAIRRRGGRVVIK